MSKKSHILIVEDEADLRRGLELALGGNFKVSAAANFEQAQALISKQSFDGAVLDVMLGGSKNGLDVLRALSAAQPLCPAIMLTGVEDLGVARAALSLGAYDYLSKPMDADKLIHTLERALKESHLSIQLRSIKETMVVGDIPVIAESLAMRQILANVEKVAKSDVPVLISGESGTGKEVIARLLYECSGCSGPFIAVHCGAIPENLLESTLFGVEKGAYTGAEVSRMGKFEQAQGGVLFLDEISTMPVALQAKLLRVLQENIFERVGGNEVLHSTARIVAASNDSLRELIDQGKFRLDIYHRLSGIVLDLPPLRSRPEDIEALAHSLLERFARKYQKQFKGIDALALNLLRQYPWPGNVRELTHVIEQAVLLHNAPSLSAGMLPKEFWQLPAASDGSSIEAVAESDQFRIPGNNYKEASEAFDRFFIGKILTDCGGNQSKAAERMGLSRTTLSSKISALGLKTETES